MSVFFTVDFGWSSTRPSCKLTDAPPQDLCCGALKVCRSPGRSTNGLRCECGMLVEFWITLCLVLESLHPLSCLGLEFEVENFTGRLLNRVFWRYHRSLNRASLEPNSLEITFVVSLNVLKLKLLGVVEEVRDGRDVCCLDVLVSCSLEVSEVLQQRFKVQHQGRRMKAAGYVIGNLEGQCLL